jgi:hypothetical protein
MKAARANAACLARACFQTFQPPKPCRTDRVRNRSVLPPVRYLFFRAALRTICVDRVWDAGCCRSCSPSSLAARLIAGYGRGELLGSWCEYLYTCWVERDKYNRVHGDGGTSEVSPDRLVARGQSCLGLPVLVHVVSRRARGLRLREADRLLRASAAGRVAFPFCPQDRRLELVLRSSIPGPPMPLSTLRSPPRGGTRKTQGQDGSLLLSCRTLSFLHAGLFRRTDILLV